MKITIIAGARPNFVKIAPLISAIQTEQENNAFLEYRLVHTGQHYDKAMSGSFFEQLGITEPDVNLGCGGGTHSEQTAKIMVSFEKELIHNPCDLVIVVGDVNSTMACAIVAKKLNVKVAHIEAGIRSLDMEMPEEINRLITDSITDYFFTTSKYANENLDKSGVDKKNVFFVGNTMIDTLISNQHKFLKPPFFEEFSLVEKEYFVLTLHRPSNVDNKDYLTQLLLTLDESCDVPIIFPVHPRTRQKIKEYGITLNSIIQVDPLSYLEFNYLVKHSKGVITDSGGITEETTVMQIPCITLRDSTERWETVYEGTNELVGENLELLRAKIKTIIDGNWKKGSVPELWDGKAGVRIISHIISIFDRIKN